MKALLFIFAFTASVAAFGRPAPRFAQSGRLFTVSFWSHHEATVWAVQSERIVVYRTFATSEPDHLIGQFPITLEQVRKMREATEAIPESAYGMIFWRGGSLDEPLLCLSFTSDGSLAANRIEFGAVFEEWLRPLCAVISDSVPPTLKIEFEATAKKSRDLLAKTGNVPPTIRTPIAEYYGPQLPEKKPPNQSLEPTTLLGTSAAEQPLVPSRVVAHL